MLDRIIGQANVVAMLKSRPRSMSQATYRIIAEIRETNARFRQIDRGLGYPRAALQPSRQGEALPLHVGPQLEAAATERGWVA